MNEKRLVVTFKTTTDAIAFWRFVKKAGIPGTLGPAPRVLQVTCGSAWLAPAEAEMPVRRLISEYGIAHEKCVVLGAEA